jgi:hypothetical protein
MGRVARPIKNDESNSTGTGYPNLFVSINIFLKIKNRVQLAPAAMKSEIRYLKTCFLRFIRNGSV